jgi:hypothetical protein
VPDQWADISAELEDDTPITLAEPIGGVGALQFSIAIHISGPRPDISCQELVEMLNDFSDSQGYTRTSDIAIDTSPCSLVVATFLTDDSYLRAWYLSNGHGIAFVTYTAAVDDFDGEISTAEAIVRSFRWRTNAA